LQRNVNEASNSQFKDKGYGEQENIPRTSKESGFSGFFAPGFQKAIGLASCY
jgi:hypothetical protein